MNYRQLVLMHIEANDDHAELLNSAATETSAVDRVLRFKSTASAGNYLFGAEETAAAVPDLIILNLESSGGDGLEFLRLVRANPITIAIPVVVFSTSESEQQIKAAYRCGANSYVVKPTTYSEMVIKLAELNMYWSVTATLPRKVTDEACLV